LPLCPFLQVESSTPTGVRINGLWYSLRDVTPERGTRVDLQVDDKRFVRALKNDCSRAFGVRARSWDRARLGAQGSGGLGSLGLPASRD
jgi:hypothetical protein